MLSEVYEEAFKMRKSRGSTSAVLVALFVIASVAVSGYLVLETIKNRNYDCGVKSLEAEDFVAAREYFIKANKYSLRPKEEILDALAECYAATGESAEAKSCYEKLISLDPHNMEYRHELGRICIADKDYKAAEQQIRILRGMKNPQAEDYADELTGSMQTGMVKGIFKDFLKKLAPALGDIPGLSDTPEKGDN